MMIGQTLCGWNFSPTRTGRWRRRRVVLLLLLLAPLTFYDRLQRRQLKARDDARAPNRLSRSTSSRSRSACVLYLPIVILVTYSFKRLAAGHGMGGWSLALVLGVLPRPRHAGRRRG